MDTGTVSTETKGMMQQIREHLAQGKSSTEIIALGYKPPTVYKVQRQMRRHGSKGKVALSSDGGSEVPGAATLHQDGDGAGRIVELQQQANELADSLTARRYWGGARKFVEEDGEEAWQMWGAFGVSVEPKTIAEQLEWATNVVEGLRKSLDHIEATVGRPPAGR